jgi:hypothetical protein
MLFLYVFSSRLKGLRPEDHVLVDVVNFLFLFLFFLNSMVCVCRAALQLSEGIAMERESLVKQLGMLKSVSPSLID